jgi:PAS domain S-box-containing protein
LLLEGIDDYAIFMLDPEGRVTSWNSGAQRILGYRDDEILGHSFELFFSSADVAAGRPAEELRSAMLHRRSADRGWRLRKDGSRFWADVVVTALHDQKGQMRGFAKIVRDLSERKRMESLEEQGRNLTEFLAMLAHELRNPLAPIRNALAIIGASEEGSTRIKWSREVIERQMLYLTRLVDDLLDVSRITRGKVRLQSATLDLRIAVQRAIESSRPLLDRRQHRLHLAAPEAPVMVHGDLTRLTQVFLNLLNNAAKYTPEGGDVWVEVDGDERHAMVRVRDNGAGIPAHARESIFDLFAQGERTIARSEGGLGVGLTLARRIVVLHGGEVSVKSEGPGTGAEFTVSLPRLDPESSEAQPVVGRAQLPSGAPHRRFLVVDDNEDAANSMAMLLRLMGHEVEIDIDGPSAIARLEKRHPNVMLLDIGLPEMDGYEVARRVRAMPGGEAIKIFALTGYGQEEDRQRSLAAGFDGHLVKPVAPGDLFLLLEGSADSPGPG